MKPPRSSFSAIGLLVLAAVLWSLNGALIKVLNRYGLHGVTIACYRSLFAGLFLIPLAWRGFRTLRPTRGDRTVGEGPTSARPPGGRGRGFLFHTGVWITVATFALMTTSFVVACTKTEAANAIILQYTSTFWIFGLSPLITGERPSRKDVPYLFVAMIGVAVIFAGNAGTDLTGLVIALTAGLFYGLLVLLLRRLRDCDPAAVTVVNNLGTVVLLLIPTIWVSGLHPPARAVALLLVMGVVQLGLPYYFFSRGLQRIPAHRAALITMLEPVLVPVWAYLAVGDVVQWPTMVGGGLILAALVWFILSAQRRAAVVEPVD
jgi:DME family drug/metabolite transporter